MTENKPRSVDGEFRVRLNTFPAGTLSDGGIVVVARDKMLLAMQFAQQGTHTVPRLANGEVAQMPNLIVGRYD